MFKSLYIIFPLWLLFFPLSIYWISEKIALCGIYHKVDSIFRDKSKDTIIKECLIDKFRMIVAANMYLSLPFIISYYVVIDNTLALDSGIGTEEIALLAFILTLVSLLVIRLLSNPPNFLLSKILCLYPTNERDNAQKILNERIISFFHSFICAAIIILGILLSANITLGNDVLIKNPEMSFVFLGTIVAIYSLNLIFFTLILELILHLFPPIIQIPQNQFISLPT